MKQTFALALCAPLLLAGCVQPVPVVVDPVDACGASRYQNLVGQPGVLLDGMRFSQDIRIIQPGMAVTTDFRSDRINFRLDQRDVIRQVSCG